jgi:hypothetical protein
MKKFLKAVSLFESSASGLQIVGQLIWLLLVGGSASLTGWLAKNAPIVAQFGPLAWIGAGIVAGLFVGIILAIMQWSNRQVRYGEYLTAMAQKASWINPMDEAFEKRIIKVPDLALPGSSLHEHKRFKNCQFLGPGAIVIQSGIVSHNSFRECGDVIALGDVMVTGLSVLRDCTITDCTFFQVTLLADQVTAKAMQQAGFKVSGL